MRCTLSIASSLPHQTTDLQSLAQVMILPMFGYSTIEEYLIDWSPCHKMDGITIPVLAINASDDPFCPLKCRFHK